ncbi:GNAT family N-acetyltransferase [Nocardiopsis trehalosi]|jgi:GNAT superfamily N-acetyltransferase|uniref:GNAT family N-acetyltransferase n=1 Tax=Nocardiopsis trehalosi TaxID=109329 RepID=UPI000829DBF2|nr:GNAT family N-acetyltransferase [Nocardiopsis trehalosi]
MRVREGGPEDGGAVLDMFDGAVAWLTARGRSAQWGSRPWSEMPERVARVQEIAAGGGLWIAEADGGEPAGALSVVDRPKYHVAPAEEPELYIDLLITARAHTGRGVGARLLDFARERARQRGVGLLRVDCWSGGDGALIRYYTGQGFTPTHRVAVGASEIQVFEQRL